MPLQEKVEMLLDDFIEQGNETVFEIINGKRIPRLPTVAGHGETLNKLFHLLLSPEIEQIGNAFIAGTYVLLAEDDTNWVVASRTPDLLFLSAKRWTEYKETYPHWRDVPLLVVPDLVIEVIAPTDLHSDVDEKVDAYLSDGVRLIVIVDPFTRKGVIRTPDAEQPLYLSGDAVLDFTEVIPGFKIALPSLFE